MPAKKCYSLKNYWKEVMTDSNDIIVLIRLIEFVFGDSCYAILHTPDCTIKLKKMPKERDEAEKTY